MMMAMTRSERNSLVAILTAIVLIIGGIVAAVLLGVRSPDDAQELARRVADPVPVADTPAPTPTSSAVAPDPLADARVNRVQTGTAPRVGDTFGSGAESFERMRSWDGEVEVWRGANPQIILGPAGNWFPAGQPGCGEGRYVVEFSGAEQLAASLRDEVGATVHEAEGRSGWMLLDDCHLPYVALTAEPDTVRDTVSFEVHEFQPAG